MDAPTALSTNEGQFVPSRGRSSNRLGDLLADEDVRRERFQPRPSNARPGPYAVQQTVQGVQVVKESPHGFSITANAPAEFDAAVKHYCSKLRSFRSQSFPVEWALCHFELGKLFAARHAESRLKDLDEALFHLQNCVHVFSMNAFPLHWAVVQLMQAELLVETLQLLHYAVPLKAASGSTKTTLARKGFSPAMACLESALMVFDEEKDPCEYALVAFTMAKAESLVVKDQKDHEQIIASVEHALHLLERVCMSDELQQQLLVEGALCGWRWIELLGLAHFYAGRGYLERLHGDRIRNWREASTHFDVAMNQLRVDTAEWVDARHCFCAASHTTMEVLDEESEAMWLRRSIDLLSEALQSPACFHIKPQLELHLASLLLHRQAASAVTKSTHYGRLYSHDDDEDEGLSEDEQICELLASAITHPASSHGNTAFVGFFGNLQLAVKVARHVEPQAHHVQHPLECVNGALAIVEHLEHQSAPELRLTALAFRAAVLIQQGDATAAVPDLRMASIFAARALNRLRYSYCDRKLLLISAAITEAALQALGTQTEWQQISTFERIESNGIADHGWHCDVPQRARKRTISSLSCPPEAPTAVRPTSPPIPPARNGRHLSFLSVNKPKPTPKTPMSPTRKKMRKILSKYTSEQAVRLALLLRQLPKRISLSPNVDLQAHANTLTAFTFLFRHATSDLLVKATALNVVGGARMYGLLQQVPEFWEAFVDIDKQAAVAGQHLSRVSLLTSELHALPFISMRDSFEDHTVLNQWLAKLETQLQDSKDLDCFIPAALCIPGFALDPNAHADIPWQFENATRFGDRHDIGEILCDRLGHDECILAWHVPASSNLPIACYLAYWEIDQQVEATGPGAYGVVVNQHKLRLIACQHDNEHSGFAILNAIQSFMDAIHKQPMAKRLVSMNQAIQHVNDALALSSICDMLPSHVETLVICAPACLRAIPWAALPIGAASNGARRTMLLDVYALRIYPSLAEWELVEKGVTATPDLGRSTGFVSVDASIAPSETGAREMDTLGTSDAEELKLANLETSVMAGAWGQLTASHWIAARALATPQALVTGESADHQPIYGLEHAQLAQAKMLSRCEVLHICANPSTEGAPGLVLRQPDDDSASSVLRAREVVRQLWLQGCRLVVLNRYALLDTTAQATKVAAATDVVDAFLLAGATSVIHPIWGVHSTSSIVCSLLVALKMTEVLPGFSARRAPLVEALRAAQLWLRSALPDDCKDVVARSSLPDLAKCTLLELLELIISVNTATGQLSPKPLFLHPYFWANMQFVGAGRGFDASDGAAIESAQETCAATVAEELEEQIEDLREFLARSSARQNLVPHDSSAKRGLSTVQVNPSSEPSLKETVTTGAGSAHTGNKCTIQ